MALTNVANVFSRYFVVGHFLPAFFGSFAVALFNPYHWLEPRNASDVLIVGGIALLFGLLLDGLSQPIHAAFSGYRPAIVLNLLPADAELKKRYSSPWGWLGELLRGRQVKAERKLKAAAAQDDGAAQWTKPDVAVALYRQRFGFGGYVRPTRLGNRARRFEDYIQRRYSLNRSAWTRISALLNEREREEIVDTNTRLRFFLNSSVVALVSGVVLTVGWCADEGFGVASLATIAAAGATSWFAYCASLDPGGGMSDLVCAAFDTHIGEFYERMGVRRPTTPADDGLVGAAITASLDLGERTPDALRSSDR